MRALTILPLILLGACQVSNDPANNTSTVTVSGDAAKNGAASALDSASNAVDRASNKIDQVSNESSDIRSGLGNLAAGAEKLGKSVDHAADNLGNAVDGHHRVEVTTDKTTTTKTEKK